MTASNILTDLYTSKEVKEVIKRLRPVHLQEDILQHTFLGLFEKPEVFILDLHDRGKLRAYIVKILYNTATYTRSSFAKEQATKEVPTDFNASLRGDIDETRGTGLKRCMTSTFEVIRFEDEEKDRIEAHNAIACAASQMHWYKFNMLQLYAELGTYQAVSEKTKIPLTSVFKTITEARKEIKQKL